jgi:hypothetical protein
VNDELEDKIPIDKKFRDRLNEVKRRLLMLKMQQEPLEMNYNYQKMVSQRQKKMVFINFIVAFQNTKTALETDITL